MGNDPINKTDPSGMAQCDKSMNGPDCYNAQSAANAARDTANSLKGAFKDLAAKVRSGKVSEADQKQLDGLSKINKSFGTAKGLDNLAKGMGNIANKIGTSGEGITLKNGNNLPDKDGKVPAGYVDKVNFGLFKVHSSTVNLNSSFFVSGNLGWRNQLLLHEAGHTAGYSGDDYGVDEVNKLEGGELWENSDTDNCAAYPSNC